MKICSNPDCGIDLEPLIASGQLRPHAECCSASCRAAKSRAKRGALATTTRTFWRGIGSSRASRIETPARLAARAKGLTGRNPAPGPPD